MEWKTNVKRHYDHSWRKVFAWKPVKCIDGNTRWLCFVSREVRFIGDAPVFAYRKLRRMAHFRGA